MNGNVLSPLVPIGRAVPPRVAAGAALWDGGRQPQTSVHRRQQEGVVAAAQVQPVTAALLFRSQ